MGEDMGRVGTNAPRRPYFRTCKPLGDPPHTVGERLGALDSFIGRERADRDDLRRNDTAQSSVGGGERR